MSIDGLPQGTTPNGTETVAIFQNGQTVKVPISQVTASAGTAALVQSAFARNGSPTTQTLTFGQIPAPGHVLVLVLIGQGQGTPANPPIAGFSQIYFNQLSTFAQCSVYAKLATGSESLGYSVAWSTGPNGGMNACLFEFSGVSSVTANAIVPTFSTATPSYFASRTSPQAITIGAMLNGNTSAYSAISGATLLQDMTSATYNDPAVIYSIPAAGPVSVTWSNGTWGNPGLLTLGIE